MAKWERSVISTGRLDVYNNIQGRWAGIFRNGLNDINGLFSQNGIRIEFREVNDHDAANVVVASANGSTTFRNGSQTFDIAMDGARLHGHTYPVGANNIIQKQFIFLPENPLLATPRGSRPTGTKVMRAIQVHEYIHSIGLSDNDHSGDDVFIGHPEYIDGSNPEEDRLGVMRRQGRVWFPPFILSASTVAKIRAAWS